MSPQVSGTLDKISLKHRILCFLKLKIEEATERFKTFTGFCPIFPPSKHYTFSQAITGVAALLTDCPERIKEGLLEDCPLEFTFEFYVTHLILKNVL
jgi:hypothetical protein